MKTLNFKTNKVEVLTLEELALTADEKSTSGQPLHGLTHVQLLTQILEKIKRFSPSAEWEISAVDNQNRYLPGVTVIEELKERFGEGSLQSHMLRRLHAKIRINKTLSEELNDIGYAIVVTFTQDGIAVAGGANVHVCDNLCIFGASEMIRTGRGDEAVAAIALPEVVEQWLEGLEEKIRMNSYFIKEMQKVMIYEAELQTMVGDLLARRICHDRLSEKGRFILNQDQINYTVESFYKNFKESPEDPLEKYCTAWEIYNYGTELMTPGKLDMTRILKDNQRWAEYVCIHCGIRPYDNSVKEAFENSLKDSTEKTEDQQMPSGDV